MKKKVMNGLVAMAFLVPVAGTVTSCKDYEGDDVAEIRSDVNEQVASLQSQINTLQSTINSLEQCDCDQTVISSLQSTVSSLQTTLNTLQGTVAGKADSDDLTSLKSEIETLLAGKASTADVAALEEALRTLIGGKADTETVNSLYTELKTALDSKVDATTLNNLMATVNESLAGKADAADVTALETKIYSTLASYVTAEQHAADLQSLSDAIGANTTNISELSAQVTALRDTLYASDQELRSQLAAINSTIESAVSTFTTLVNNITAELAGKVDATTYNIFVESATTQLTELRVDVDALKASVASDSVRIDNLSTALTALQENYDNLLNSIVTGVTFNAAYSPVIGYYKEVLTGARSSILAAYYGENSEAVTFPTSNADYITNDVEISSSEIPIGEKVTIPAGLLYDEEEGNAGYVFFNLDTYSSSFDATASNVSAYLETNTGNTNSGVKISNLRKADTELGFGYTRSSGQSYMADATLSSTELGNIALGNRVIIPDNFVSNVKSALSDLDLKQLANDLGQIVMDNMGGLNGAYPAYSLVVNSGVQNVSSDFDIMTAALSPLSFTFMQDASYSRLPGLSTIENMIEKIVNQVAESLDMSFENTSDRVGEITYDTESGIIYVTIETDPITTYEINVTDPSLGFTETDLAVLEKLAENSLAINKIVDSLNDAVDAFATVSGSISDIATTITDYLERFNSTVISYINDINIILQPIMVFRDDATGCYYRAVGATTGASFEGDELTLIPTSPTLELLAPAYKRYLYVVNTSTGDVAEIEGAAEGQVFSGNQHEFSVKFPSKGVYKVVYEAVDYDGKVAASKTYINVK